MRLLLDTCTFLWRVASPEKVSDEVRAAIANPGNEVFLSAVSVWEIAVKHSLGQLEFSKPPDRYVPEFREAHGFRPLPFDEESALLVVRLPNLHKDPFDRMLICQALVQSLTLLTPDEQIREYPVRTLW